MPKNIKITASERSTPDVDRLVQALLLIIRARATAAPVKEARDDHAR